MKLRRDESGDIHVEDLPLAMTAFKLLYEAKGCENIAIFLKWTCPGCGERVTADEPDTVYPKGVIHTEKADGTPCRTEYRGGYFGWTVAMMVPPSKVEEVMSDFRE